MLNSPVDIALVFGVALLLFGPKKLPELGKSLGQGIGNFKRSLQEASEEIKSAVKTDPAAKTEEAPTPPAPVVSNSTSADDAAKSDNRVLP